MNILCIGAGYVGGPTMAVISKYCPEHTIKVVDLNKNRISAWNSSDLPIYEPGLAEVVMDCRNLNLFFEVISPEHIKWADIIFVSVNTPTKTYGQGEGQAADLQYWESTARFISAHANGNKIIVEKSTLPVRTAESMQRILQNSSPFKFEVLSNPEFLAEGTAIKDLDNPDRILIGGDSTESAQKAVKALKDIYLHWVPEEKILTHNVWSAELSKLVANAFLAQRVSSINSISALTEVTGADIEEVSKSIGMDSRIGSKFLKASIGFGGSCFKKDILNLVYICRSYGLNEVADYWESVVNINEYQKKRFVEKIIGSMFNTIAGKSIAVLGLAFKSDTSDVREAPAFTICKYLLNENANLAIHDPRAIDNFLKESGYFHDPSKKYCNVIGCTDVYDAVNGADAVLVLTDWKEYLSLDYRKIYDLMRKPSFVFDGRNFLNHDELKKIGFNVYSIGKSL